MSSESYLWMFASQNEVRMLAKRKKMLFLDHLEECEQGLITLALPHIFWHLCDAFFVLQIQLQLVVVLKMKAMR